MRALLIRVVRHRALRDERGVAAVEFALVSLVFIVLLFGMITYGFIFGLHHDMTHAAAEGARAALRAPYGDEVTYAIDRAESALSFEQAKDHATVTAQVITGPACDPNVSTIRCIHVTIELSYDEHPVVPSLFGIGTPDTIKTEAILQL